MKERDGENLVKRNVPNGYENVRKYSELHKQGLFNI